MSRHVFVPVLIDEGTRRRGRVETMIGVDLWTNGRSRDLSRLGFVGRICARLVTSITVAAAGGA